MDGCNIITIMHACSKMIQTAIKSPSCADNQYTTYCAETGIPRFPVNNIPRVTSSSGSGTL